MTVMIDPVTTGGKNRIRRERNGATTRPTRAATTTAPATTRSPRSPSLSPAMMVTIVETEAKLMPWTSGRRDPRNGTPIVCRIVARPLTSSAHATSVADSAGSSPAAPPTMSGTAIMPPTIARTCWRP